MMTNPDMVFSTDPRHGLVARSGWEQEEARTVLRDLGWEWEEELHALVPPDDVPEVDAGVQAVEELHLHGHRAGYAVGPYGTMRLTLDRAEQVFTKLAVRDTNTAEVRSEKTPQDAHQTPSRQQWAYDRGTSQVEAVPTEAPESPAI
ncbi:hypothetical protein AB0I98_27450 [Streptomyces sp. NPDC050211]|uniref:hypothetical protein n=1 Tax=Streptomyces sp. NPDC050211 TaxID=3154932 RepID=UPI00343DAD2F